jgi:DMSO/TMAO reductase YedYZ heme-binding membrane subunit
MAETAVTWIAVCVAFASVAVNLRAWGKRPYRHRRALYLWSAFVSFGFGLAYLLALAGVVSLAVLTESLTFRWLAILTMFGLLLHGLVDT